VELGGASRRTLLRRADRPSRASRPRTQRARRRKGSARKPDARVARSCADGGWRRACRGWLRRPHPRRRAESFRRARRRARGACRRRAWRRS
jgi:hypothetical protein